MEEWTVRQDKMQCDVDFTEIKQEADKNSDSEERLKMKI